MNLSDIRTRLAGLGGRSYWRSLEEYADTPEFREYLHREFPAQASEFTDPAGRREFLKLMGASIALAGVSACTRQPEEKIIPYVRQPDQIVPGRPLFFATAMPSGGYAMPVLAENHMGRPTKIEGNPEHPASLGATDVFAQASVLSLYDPDRSRNILGGNAVRTWDAAVSALQGAVNAQRAVKGEGLRILTEPITSPSLTDQIQALLSALPEARWHQWDPVYGVAQGGAPAAMPIYRFDKADVVVSLDADFLGTGAGMLRYTKDFSSRRRISTPQDELNRLYVVEPVPTITGGKADHRLAVKAREVHTFAAALAGLGGVAGASTGTVPGENGTKFASAVAQDLHQHHGRSVIVAGPYQPAAVHVLARQMNEALGNVGSTVFYTQPIAGTPADGAASLTDLVSAMNAGKVDVLLILGSNPVFTAPADLNFTAALAKVASSFHLGLYHDETAYHCHWHVPEAHYLESWGDARSFDGTVSLMQPLIAPLYDGRQAIELIAAMNGQTGRAADLVRDYWTRAFQGKTSTTWSPRDREGKPFASLDQFWRHALHDGFMAGTSIIDWEKGALTAPAAGPSPAAAAPPAATGGGPYEIVFRPDPTVLDGRHANNGWLQELPKPFSKVTWDNVAYVSANTAKRLGVPLARPGNHNQPILEIKYKDRTTRLPVWVLPGTADDVVVVHFGYGRERSGRVGNKIGQNTFGIRTSTAPWFDAGADVTKTADVYLVVSTQNHFVMEGRDPVRATTADAFRSNPRAIAELGPFGKHEEAAHEEAAHLPEKQPGGVSRNSPKVWSLYKDDEFKYESNKWGMTIDLNACTGCNACVTACQAENNTAVVGKEQVERNREMHWIRVDTYFAGDAEKPEGFHQQPVPCMQCENAPCEVVCPVAATQHNTEGLNDMVYNRCVGTRYCSNNCPYKVRRFNFLLYSDFTTPELWAQRNPDVTIRSRGVMEKCTYCVQRISHARIDAKTEGRPIKDGDVVTACQQVCPADAIVFGDLNDPDSKVAKLVAQERNYGILEDLNTRPRTTYLAVVKNPNKTLA
jgi:molybdopterin-containing oxidoreductase family iron-sulfur binding subunit